MTIRVPTTPRLYESMFHSRPERAPPERVHRCRRHPGGLVGCHSPADMSNRHRGRWPALMLNLSNPRIDWSVLDWNETAIRFHPSLGAVPMDRCTGYRLSGKALAAQGSTDDQVHWALPARAFPHRSPRHRCDGSGRPGCPRYMVRPRDRDQ